MTAAAFTAGADDASAVVHVVKDQDRPLRCASVLKPVYFWAAATLPPLRDDRSAWSALAEPAVTRSANDATVHVWQTCGPDALLDGIHGLTGVRLRADPDAERTFGRVLVSADEAAQAYGALAVAARDGDPVARPLLSWMRQVPDEQTFGARSSAASALGRPTADVAVKTGWFVDADEAALRTHAVTVTVLPDGTVRGTAVLTALPVDEAFRRRYAATYVHGEEVLPMHDQVAAETIMRVTAGLL